MALTKSILLAPFRELFFGNFLSFGNFWAQESWKLWRVHKWGRQM